MGTKNAAKKTAGRPRPRAGKADGESAVLATIAAMPTPDAQPSFIGPR